MEQNTQSFSWCTAQITKSDAKAFKCQKTLRLKCNKKENWQLTIKDWA